MASSSEHSAEQMWEDFKVACRAILAENEFDEQDLIILGVLLAVAGLVIQHAWSKLMKKTEEENQQQEEEKAAKGPKEKEPRAKASKGVEVSEVGDGSEDGEDDDVLVDEDDAKKSIPVAYLLLTFGGFQGAHHFYLGDTTTGTSYIFTLGYLSFGVIYDFFTLWYKVMKHNKAALAPKTLGFWRLVGKSLLQISLSIAFVTWLSCVFFFIVPLTLHYTTAIDLYTKRGNLSMSPHELLDVSRFCSYDTLKKSYRAMSIKFHPDRCGSECTTQMQELNVAHDLIKDGLFSDLEQIEHDWVTVDEFVQALIPPYGTWRSEWALTEDAMLALGNTVMGRSGKRPDEKKKSSGKKHKNGKETKKEEKKEKKKSATDILYEALNEKMGGNFDVDALMKEFGRAGKKKEAKKQEL